MWLGCTSTAASQLGLFLILLVYVLVWLILMTSCMSYDWYLILLMRKLRQREDTQVN